MKRTILLIISAVCFTFSIKAQNDNVTSTIKGKKRSSSVTFKTRVQLPEALKEASGLIFWDGHFWSHNDSGGCDRIIAFDPDTVSNYKEYIISKEHQGVDWEAIYQDEDYIYIGDFGNNAGNRRDLKILKLDKKQLQKDIIQIDTIHFSYSTQSDFTQAFGATDFDSEAMIVAAFGATDFDCEAMIAAGDSIYLFTKQWKSKKTDVFSLSKIPGNQVAKYKESYDCKGLITDAVYVDSLNLLVLCAYSRNFTRQFFYVFTNSTADDFFSGDRYNLTMNLGFFPHQMEGITTMDGKTFYVVNERFSSIPQRLHSFDLEKYTKRNPSRSE